MYNKHIHSKKHVAKSVVYILNKGLNIMFDTYTRDQFLNLSQDQLATKLAVIEDIIFNAYLNNVENQDMQDLIHAINMQLLSEN